MAWIESHQELVRHPKTRKLSRKLGITIPAAIGHLHMLWWWALDYAQDGDVSSFEPEDIADAIDWPLDRSDLLLDALIDSEFIDDCEGKLVIHDWFDYVGRLIDKREQNRERKRKSRSNKRKINDGHAPVTHPSQSNESDDSGGHGATVPNSNSTEPITAITTTTPESENKQAENSNNLTPEAQFQALCDAYCALHQIGSWSMKGTDVTAIQSVVTARIPPEFAIPIMEEVNAEKMQREGKRFKKASSFSYYLDAIKEAWEVKQSSKNGGYASVTKAGSTARSYGANSKSHRSNAVTDQDVDNFITA